MAKNLSLARIACCAIAALSVSGCVSSGGGVYIPAPHPEDSHGA